MSITLLRRRRRKPQPQPRRFPPRLYLTATWQPPAPIVEPTPVPWTPPYAELELAKVLRRYGNGPADIAARFLREVADNTVNTGGAL